MAAKAQWYIYQARRVATQANAAGGAQKIDIIMGANQTGILLHGRAVSSGTATNLVNIYDEDTAYHAMLTVTAATTLNFPIVGIATGQKVYLAPGQKLAIEQQSAGNQGDTLTISVTMLLSSSIEPTWDKSRSANAADVTLAPSTISAAIRPVVP